MLTIFLLGLFLCLPGPYQHGTGFPAVNGDSKLDLFDSNIPIQVSTGATGPGLPNVFASEFGSSVYSRCIGLTLIIRALGGLQSSVCSFCG